MKELLVGDKILIVLGALSVICTIAAIIIYIVAKKPEYSFKQNKTIETTKGKKSATAFIIDGKPIRLYHRKLRRYAHASRRMVLVKKDDSGKIVFENVGRDPLINNKVIKPRKKAVKQAKRIKTEE